MQPALHKSYHAVYCIHLHVVLVTKYRRRVITSEILDKLRQIVSQLCQVKKRILAEFSSQFSRNGIGAKSSMKFKLFNILTICLATSGLLAPATATFGQNVGRKINLESAEHLVCVKEEQHLLCDVENSRQRDKKEAGNQAAVKLAKVSVPLKSSTVTVVGQLLSPAQQKTIANMILGFSYLVLPCGLALGIFLYDKYFVYRSAVLNEQIEFLERLWKQSTEQ